MFSTRIYDNCDIRSDYSDSILNDVSLCSPARYSMNVSTDQTVTDSLYPISIALPHFSTSKQDLEFSTTTMTQSACDFNSSGMSSDSQPVISSQGCSYDDSMTLIPRSNRSLKHSEAEKKRVIRFNLCTDELYSMLSDNGVAVKKNKLNVLIETVSLLDRIQREVNSLHKQERQRKERKSRQIFLRNNQLAALPYVPVESSTYYRLFNENPAAMAIISIGGIIVDANRSFCEVFNISRENSVSVSFFSLVHSSLLSLLYTSFSNMLSSPSSKAVQVIRPILCDNVMVPHVLSFSLIVDKLETVFCVSIQPIIHRGSPCQSTCYERSVVVDEFMLSSGESYCLLDQTSRQSSKTCPVMCASEYEAICADSCIPAFEFNIDSPKSKLYGL